MLGTSVEKPVMTQGPEPKRVGAADAITAIRIVCSMALLFCTAFAPVFYILYVIAGLTDMADGAVARRTGTASDFGARLDSAADFALVAACLVKLLPELAIPRWLWVWTAVIALVKAVNLVSGYVVQKRLVALHTAMNKAAGALLFLLPLTMPFVPLAFTAPIVCAVATFAAVQEGHFIRTGRED